MNEIKSIKSAFAKVAHNEDGLQVVVLPDGFHLDASEVEIETDGEKLIISPRLQEKVAPQSWSEFFDNLEPVELDWPDVDEGLLPTEEVDLLK